jgi:heme exporter protein C
MTVPTPPVPTQPIPTELTPTRPTAAARVRAAVLPAAAVLALAVLAWLALRVAPPDAVQGDAQRLMYLHVPVAWLAYLAFGVTALASLLYLLPWTRRPRWDLLAGASAEIGTLFTALTILDGSLWARPVWGIWWTWDARLVTTAVLLFLYLGYLALRRVPAPADRRARRCAVVALIAFADVPVVHLSVIWWRTLHQQPTVLNPELSPQIHGVMAVTLLWGVAAFTLLYAVLLRQRYRLARAEAALDARALQLAIAARVPAPQAPAPQAPAPHAPALVPGTAPADREPVR